MRLRGIAGLAVLLATFDVTGVAAAEAGADVDQPFAAQGEAAGLTAALQAEADRYLREFGGNQVALNQIELTGATIRIAAPGEQQPRRLGTAAVRDANCDGGGADHHHFCAYRRSNFTGANIDMYACGVYDIPESWVGPGSWVNNQSTGTRARMLNDAGSVVHTTPPARSRDANGNWTPVDRVWNC